MKISGSLQLLLAVCVCTVHLQWFGVRAFAAVSPKRSQSNAPVGALKDKVYLVTGATDNVGRFTARKLGEMGAKVLIHGWNHNRIRATLQSLRMITGNRNYEGFYADLSRVSQVEHMATQVLGATTRLDGLVNNAGVYFREPKVTQDGMESTFAVNVAAPFLLTARLWPLLSAAPDARVLNAAVPTTDSPGDISDPMFRRERYNPRTAYARSKLALWMMTKELAVRTSGNVTCMSVEPADEEVRIRRTAGTILEELIETEDEFQHMTRDVTLLDHGQHFRRMEPTDPGPEVHDAYMRADLWRHLEYCTGIKFRPS